MNSINSTWLSSIDSHCAHLLGRACSPRTITGRRKQLLHAARWLQGRGLTAPIVVNERHLEAYGAWLAGPTMPRCPATCRNHLTALRVYFQELHRHGAIPTNPALGVPLPPPAQVLPRAILDQVELRAIRAAALKSRCHRVRNRAIVELLYATGIRRAECTALAIGDVDAQRQVVFVRHGKGRRQRVVPIAPLALQWIGAYLRRERRLTLRVLEPTGPLFSRGSGKPLTPKHLSDLVGSILKRAQVAKPGACHVFRHSMATHMLDNGADIRFIQVMLGHADISTTMRYTQVSIRSLAEVYRRTHPSCV